MPQTLSITIDDDGKVSLAGPLKNMLLCYGMLETAKDALKAWHQEQRTQEQTPAARIQLADAMALPRGERN